MKSRRQGFLNQTSLDERSVQAVARGAVDLPRHRRTRGPSNPITHSHLLDGLGASARDALPPDVDLRCVQVVDACTAIIWNHPAPWPGSESELTQPSQRKADPS